jgi:hypothetical protein
MRFLQVLGVAGALVSVPGAPDRRYAGMRLAPRPAAGWPADSIFASRHVPVEQILQDHPDLRSAAAKNDLQILGEVVAPNAEAADGLLNAAKREGNS